MQPFQRRIGPLDWQIRPAECFVIMDEWWGILQVVGAVLQFFSGASPNSEAGGRAKPDQEVAKPFWDGLFRFAVPEQESRHHDAPLQCLMIHVQPAVQKDESCQPPSKLSLCFSPRSSLLLSSKTDDKAGNHTGLICCLRPPATAAKWTSVIAPYLSYLPLGRQDGLPIFASLPTSASAPRGQAIPLIDERPSLQRPADDKFHTEKKRKTTVLRAVI